MHICKDLYQCHSWLYCCIDMMSVKVADDAVLNTQHFKCIPFLL